MKITFMFPTVSLGGGTKVVAIYCDLLTKRGHTITVISVPPKPPSLRFRLRSLLRDHKWITSDFHPPSHLDGLAINHRVLDKWRPITDRDVPDGDVVVATWWETAEWVAALDPSKGAKAYFVQDHEVFEHLPVERVRATYDLPLHKVVVSKWLGEVMAEEYSDQLYDLVPNSVDQQQFDAEKRDKHSCPTFGFLYTPSPRKSVKTCIAAIEQAKKIMPELRVLAFGAQMPISSLPLPEWVEFHESPTQEKIPQIYAGCDAWLFSSETEGFGLPLLEAMACRTPVIATPAGAAPELLASGGGIPVPVNDPEAIVAAMEQIHDMSKAEWGALSERAYQTAAKNNWDDATDLFEQALMNAVSRAERNEIAGGPSTLGTS